MGVSYGFETAGKLEPYVGTGLTYLDINPNAVSSTIGRRIEVRHPEEVGIFFMAGANYPIGPGKLSLFAEAIYRNVKANANSVDIRDFDTNMTGLGANFGLVLNF